MTPGLRRLLRFAVVGVANTVVDFGSFNLLLALGVHRGVSNVVAVSLAVFFSYAMNRAWTFEGAPGGVRTLVRFLAVTGTGMAVNTLVVVLAGNPDLYPWLPHAAVLAPNAAKMAAAAISTTLNYLGYSRLVFRPAPAAETQDAR